MHHPAPWRVYCNHEESGLFGVGVPRHVRSCIRCTADLSLYAAPGTGILLDGSCLRTGTVGFVFRRRGTCVSVSGRQSVPQNGISYSLSGRYRADQLRCGQRAMAAVRGGSAGWCKGKHHTGIVRHDREQKNVRRALCGHFPSGNYLAATAAAAVVTATVALAATVAAEAIAAANEQQDQNDDPPAAVTAKTASTTHNSSTPFYKM